MKIEVLYLDGCPNVMPTLERLKRVLAESGLKESIILTPVSDHESAQALRFLGSPTVRINGIDIEPSAHSRSDFGIMCRTYGDGGGVPSEKLLRGAVVEATTIVLP